MLTKHKTADSAAAQDSSGISLRAFVVVVSVLLAILIFCGSLSYFSPQGAFDRDLDGNIIPGTYQQGQTEGIAPWRVLTAPVRVFASEDAVTIIMISIFLLIMSGVFNILEKTGGIIQGMSGSPVIQNGRIVGAVTHVLINDPTKGYGIFIENMLEAAG